MSHTPTPWYINMEINGSNIAAVEPFKDIAVCFSNSVPIPSTPTIEEGQANAAHIVLCVNSHDKLVAAVKAAKTSIILPEFSSDEQVRSSVLKKLDEALKAAVMAGSEQHKEQ